jgi:hypothetical protein
LPKPLAKATWSARDFLLAKEEDPVLEQRRADLGEDCRIARRLADVDAGNLGPDGRGDLPDLHFHVSCCLVSA